MSIQPHIARNVDLCVNLEGKLHAKCLRLLLIFWRRGKLIIFTYYTCPHILGNEEGKVFYLPVLISFCLSVTISLSLSLFMNHDTSCVNFEVTKLISE